jgi:hypothetical protein
VVTTHKAFTARVRFWFLWVVWIVWSPITKGFGFIFLSICEGGGKVKLWWALDIFSPQLRLNGALVVAKSHALEENVWIHTVSWFVTPFLAMASAASFPVMLQ